MAIITDPDNLDRLQVLVDYYNQKIGIKPVFSTTPLVNYNLLAETGVGETQGDQAYPYAFKAASFAGSGVASGDILTILNGQNIDHWTITGLVDSTGLLVSSPFGATGETDINYAILTPTGGTVTDGATLQAIYSFLKEEWKTAGSGFVDLIQFIFPLESITREQFEIGGATHGDFDWRDNDTRELIRTGGWAKLDSAGTVKQTYAGVITLGSLDSDTQVYYQQVDSTSGTVTDPKNFVLTGPVNQAILVQDTDAGDDFRTFLKIFARKKGKSYSQSEIADIGVSTLESIVNRFPVTHGDDPAIVDSDGDLAGGVKIYQTGVILGTGTDYTTSVSSASAQEKTFTVTVAAGDFQASGVTAKDFINLQGTDAALDDDFFEIISVDSATQLTLLQEPTVAIPAEASITGVLYSRRRANERSDGQIQNIGGSDLSGTLTSAASDFVSSGVAAGDIVGILASGSTSLDENVGTYKVLSITDLNNVVLDTQDQPFPTTQSAATFNFEVYRPGMYLQYKREVAANVGADATSGLVMSSASPDTIQRRDGGNFATDGYVVGGVIRVGNAEDAGNIGSYVISGISTTTETNDTVSLFQNTTLTANAADTTATLSGENGFLRSPQNQAFSYNWRLFGNDGTLANCFQWLQKQLRRGASVALDDSDFRTLSDISTASGVFRGDVTDLLMNFASPNGTTLNLFIDDLNANEKNNVTFEDVLGVGRNFAFLSVISISVNANIIDDDDTKLVVFFTNDDAGDNTGRDYGTDEAIIVQDTSNSDMIAGVSADITSSPVNFEYDFDNNTQRGAASAGTPAPVTIVAIGLNTAQYVSTAGTVTRQSTNTFSLVSALERNYSNT
ncbi:MAG: hypothetical protein ACTSPB_11260 [Candidatus Thorarchaeota archaeon]